jgi:spore germination cell wall hydrolase CwlJ-like protein
MAVAAFGTVFAGPSRAWEFNTPPVVSSQEFLSALPNQDAAPASDPSPVQATETPEAPAPDLATERDAQPAPERRSLAELVDDHASATTRDAEHECLANAIYFESKGEPLSGQLSVAEVVLNRARSGRFPASICGVIKQRGQFSFVRGGRLPSVPRASLAWRKAVAVAHIALQDLADGAAPKALFFHAKRVNPSWRGLRKIGAVGNHIFYR